MLHSAFKIRNGFIFITYSRYRQSVMIINIIYAAQLIRQLLSLKFYVFVQWVFCWALVVSRISGLESIIKLIHGNISRAQKDVFCF